MKLVVCKNHLGGQSLYRSPNPGKKNGVIVLKKQEILSQIKDRFRTPNQMQLAATKDKKKSKSKKNILCASFGRKNFYLKT